MNIWIRLINDKSIAIDFDKGWLRLKYEEKIYINRVMSVHPILLLAWIPNEKYLKAPKNSTNTIVSFKVPKCKETISTSVILNTFINISNIPKDSFSSDDLLKFNLLLKKDMIFIVMYSYTSNLKLIFIEYTPLYKILISVQRCN